MNEEPLTLIKNALIVGAAANFGPNKMAIAQEVVDAYQELKTLVGRKYRRVEADIMEIGPGSAARQETLEQQLAQDGVDEDKEVVTQARTVLETVRRHDPEAMKAVEPTESVPHN